LISAFYIAYACPRVILNSFEVSNYSCSCHRDGPIVPPNFSPHALCEMWTGGVYLPNYCTEWPGTNCNGMAIPLFLHTALIVGGLDTQDLAASLSHCDDMKQKGEHTTLTAFTTFIAHIHGTISKCTAIIINTYTVQCLEIMAVTV